MKRRLLVILLLSLIGGIAVAQKEEVLTNKAVTDLVKAGLDNSIIISKIESSSCKFDLSTTGLVGLKKDGVSSDVIKAMMDKGSVMQGETTAKPSPTPTATVSATPAPTSLNEIGYLDKSRHLQMLEKEKAKLAVKALGYGNQTMEVEGNQSTVRIASGDAPVFVVGLADAMGDPSGWFTLYKASVKKNRRSAPWYTALSSGSKDVVAYTIRKAGNGVYEMTPSIKLEAGEYFFVAKGTLGNYSGKGADVFAFGID